MRNDFESNYLAHHGILGQRKGVKNGPPYPLKAGAHSASEKKAGWMKSLSDKVKDHKKAKQRKKALEKARATKAANAKKAAYEKQLEENKQKVLKSGTATDVKKYKGKLTNDELKEVWTRLDWEGKISDMASKEAPPDQMDKFFKKLDKYTDYANTAIKAYDVFIDVYNAFSGEAPKKKIKTGGDNKKKDGGKKK